MNQVHKYFLRTGLVENIQKYQKFSTTNIYHQKEAQTEATSTVDTKDIHHHGQLMKEWWDELGAIKALHSMNLVRVPFIRDGLVQCSPDERNFMPLSNKKILDVGCGGGILSEALAKIGATVTGVDAGKDLIDLAIQHSKVNPKLANNQPSYICTTIEEHCRERINYYDAVVASEVIEHVSNKELFVKACIETLKPGGRIFFTTPNKSRVTQILGIYVAEYIFNLIPKGTHQYDKFMTPPELTFLLERIIEQRLRYIAVRPSASIAKLRQKVWHLLDLPDYCDEIIVLKTSDEKEVPLTSLCRGNDPHHPYILEVWFPECNQTHSIPASYNNMLTMGDKKTLLERNQQTSIENIGEEMPQDDSRKAFVTHEKISDTPGVLQNHQLHNILHADQKKSDLSFKFSNSSLFFKIPRRNSADNFTCILLKIQNDLTALSSKLSQLENKINV